MDTFEAIYSRRAIKHFDSSHKMSADEVTKLLEATIQAPTSFNIQHWRFVVVQDPALRQQIRANGNDQAQLTEASLLIIVTADVNAWKKDPARYWVNAPKPVQDFLVPAIAQYYEERPQVERDEAMRSCGIAAQTLMLAANAMGYDACPMDGFDFDAVGKLIHLPEDHAIAMFVAIGKGTEPAWPRPGQLPMSDVVVEDRFGS